ncbi:hypothetical protein NDU88_006395 [Pleurodeles waltl]|uniref:Uncharacterized protein n=1 Tax=Pleurodeles waltl TaxID=8319 RepID=A0AAV7UM00_PLEWA|nr:hypothetical protein NDU88_006395 [Pleurodeles waltl]
MLREPMTRENPPQEWPAESRNKGLGAKGTSWEEQEGKRNHGNLKGRKHRMCWNERSEVNYSKSEEPQQLLTTLPANASGIASYCNVSVTSDHQATLCSKLDHHHPLTQQSPRSSALLEEHAGVCFGAGESTHLGHRHPPPPAVLLRQGAPRDVDKAHPLLFDFYWRGSALCPCQSGGTALPVTLTAGEWPHPEAAPREPDEKTWIFCLCTGGLGVEALAMCRGLVKK